MIKALLFMGATLACAFILLRLEKNHFDRSQADDEATLRLLAFEHECSIYDLFVKSGAAWSFSKAKIERDFNSYLSQGDIPHYVNAYARRLRPARPSYQSSLFTGNRLPPNTGA